MVPRFFMSNRQEKSERNRLEILKESYWLMAGGSWDAISITTLEMHISQTRGAIFYFNKNKSDLFINMIDELFFPVFQLSPSQKEKFRTCSTKIFLATYRTAFERVLDDLRENYGFVNPSRNLLNIISQAQKHYPGFTQKIKASLVAEIDFVNQIAGVRNRFHLNGDNLFIQSAGQILIDSLS